MWIVSRCTGRYALLLCILTLSSCALGWKNATDINVTPWLKDAPAVAQFHNTLVDFSPAARSRRVRLKGSGISNSFTTDQCGEIGDRLIRRMVDIEKFRLSGKAFDGQPRYFANKLFFLISIEPAVIVLVPYKFHIRDSTLSINNPYFNYEINEVYSNIDDQKHRIQLNGFSAHLTNWTNYLDLTPYVPNTQGIEVISDLWENQVSIEAAMKDTRFKFVATASSKFPGYLEFHPRK